MEGFDPSESEANPRTSTGACKRRLAMRETLVFTKSRQTSKVRKHPTSLRLLHRRSQILFYWRCRYRRLVRSLHDNSVLCSTWSMKPPNTNRSSTRMEKRGRTIQSTSFIRLIVPDRLKTKRRFQTYERAVLANMVRWRCADERMKAIFRWRREDVAHAAKLCHRRRAKPATKRRKSGRDPPVYVQSVQYWRK